MTTTPPESARELRQQAVEKVCAAKAAAAQPLLPEEAERLIYELRVHQVELEMQNEELLRTHHDLVAAKGRYFDLYDLAPVGYLTLSPAGLIQEANLAVANMLLVGRAILLKQPFNNFIFPEDQDLFYRHRQRVFTSSVPLVVEMLLKRPDGSSFWAQLQTSPAPGGELWIAVSDISERKQAEEELSKQVDFNNRVFNASDANMAVIDRNGVILGVNDAWCNFAKSNLGNDERSWGAGANYFVKYDEKWGDAKLAEEAYAGIRKVQTGELTRFRLEYPCHGTGNEQRWFHMSVLPLKGNDGTVMVSHVNITTRKQVEHELQQSNELNRNNALLLQSVMEHFPGVVFWKDITSVYVGCNKAFSDAAGLMNVTEIVGKSDFDLPWAEAEASHYRTDDRTVLESGTAKMHIIETQHQADGGTVWFDTSKVPLIDEHGIMWGVLGVSNDITELKQVEDALRESENEFRLLAESMPQMVWVCTPDGKCIYFSQLWADYTGLSLEESYGDGWNKPFHPDEQKMAWDAWQNATQNLAIYSLECRIRRYDGEYFWWLIRGVPVLDEQGAVRKWFGTCTDIEELKQAEAQLMNAKAAAETANIAKSQFLSTMSHEIRTPMNGVLGAIQLLQRTELTDEQRELTEISLRSGKNLVALLNDILDLAKIEAGKMELEVADFYLPSMISDTITILALQAREKGLLLTSSLDRDVPSTLKGDAGRLRQIIVNLVGNAIKFTPTGTITLHIQKVSEDAHSTTLCFLVQDSGIGIAVDKLEQIFAPFTQANGSTTRTYGGTGLGLAICKQLVELMGGTIAVESRDGEGSTFRFTIVLEKQGGAALPLSPINNETHREPFSVDGIRILLTEDDPVARLFVTRLLKNYGYLVDVASDGKDALDALEKNDYALVLMDCMMPEMNGYEVTAVIRDPASAVRRHDIPVIALTGNAMKQDRDRCIVAGMNDHLPKPLLFPDLLAMLEKYLKGGTK